MGVDTLLCDDRRPRNGPAKQIHNLIGIDGTPPSIWREQAEGTLMGYPSVKRMHIQVQSLMKKETAFFATFSDGSQGIFQKVVLAYGIVDRLPQVAGFSELWGTSVFHCPFCHGFEHRDETLGLVCNTDAALVGGDAVLFDLLTGVLGMLRRLSGQVTLFANEGIEFTQNQQEKLSRLGVSLVTTAISELVMDAGRLKAVRCTDAGEYPLQRLFITPQLPLEHKAPFAHDLGCTLQPVGAVVVDAMGKTSVEGVFAAGDIIDLRRQSVAQAIASGQMAGGGIVHDLIAHGH